MEALEQVIPGRACVAHEHLTARTQHFVSKTCEAVGLSTGAERWLAAAPSPFQRYGSSRAVTVLNGRALVEADGVERLLGHTHRVVNASSQDPLLLHRAATSSHPTPDLVSGCFGSDDTACTTTTKRAHVVRFTEATKYGLAPRPGTDPTSGGQGDTLRARSTRKRSSVLKGYDSR